MVHNPKPKRPKNVYDMDFLYAILKRMELHGEVKFTDLEDIATYRTIMQRLEWFLEEGIVTFRIDDKSRIVKMYSLTEKGKHFLKTMDLGLKVIEGRINLEDSDFLEFSEKMDFYILR